MGLLLPERLKTGVTVKLKKVPFKVKLFKLVAKEANDVRWQIEQFHREIKQFLMGF